MNVRRAPSRAWFALALGLALGAWAAPEDAPQGDALTLEDVVRLHVSGVGEEALIARIRSAQVDFDVSEPMLEELRLAGLGERVIQAMLARQLELHPPPAPAEPVAPEPVAAPAALALRLHVGSPGAGDEASPPLRVADAPPPELLRQLGHDGAARFEDLAVWVGCLTATHVPDHWRSESRLGRDFEGTPRHRLLAFVSGATHEDAGPRGARWLSLTVPESLPVELDPADAHQIVIGVALQIAGRYYTASLSSRVDLAPGEAPREIEAWIVPGGPDPRSIEVRIPDPPQAP